MREMKENTWELIEDKERILKVTGMELSDIEDQYIEIGDRKNPKIENGKIVPLGSVLFVFKGIVRVDGEWIRVYMHLNTFSEAIMDSKGEMRIIYRGDELLEYLYIGIPELEIIPNSLYYV